MKNPLENYIEVCNKITAICLERNLTEVYASVLSHFYFQVKSLNTLNLFDEDPSGKYMTSILLGEVDLDSCYDLSEEEIELYKTLKTYLNNQNNLIRNTYGRENMIYDALKMKKRLYEDKDFFEKVKFDYLTLITPNMPNYTLEKSIKIIDEYYANQKNKKFDDIDELLNEISNNI